MNPSQEALKELVGLEVARRVSDGQVVGIGSGTTVIAAVACIGARIESEGIRVRAVVASYEAEMACLAAGIQVVPATSADVRWAFDGADEVDPRLDLLKGRGGALLRERLVDSIAEHLVIVVDESKLVSALGTAFPLTVEIIPDARNLVPNLLRGMGATDVSLRMANGKDGPIVTEFGNLLLDARFRRVDKGMSSEIKRQPGVVETGLFEDMCDELLVAKRDGVWQASKGRRGTAHWTQLKTDSRFRHNRRED